MNGGSFVSIVPFLFRTRRVVLIVIVYGTNAKVSFGLGKTAQVRADCLYVKREIIVNC